MRGDERSLDKGQEKTEASILLVKALSDKGFQTKIYNVFILLETFIFCEQAW